MRKRISQLPYFFRGIGENKGMTFSQKERGLHTLMYEVWHRGVKLRYDVFEIRSVIFEYDEFVSRREKYPNAESIGDWAWSFEDYAEAIEKFNDIEKICIKMALLKNHPF